MKKELLVSLLIILLSIQLTIAIEINFSKENYQPQETMQVEITGNFFSLSKENIKIYKQDTPRLMPVISDLTKQDNIYYFYAILPDQEGNFSLRIEDTQYTEMGETKEDAIIKEFVIQKTNQSELSALSINQGFILTKEDFNLKIKSPFTTLDITAILEATDETKTETIQEGDEKTFFFSISGIEQKQTNLKITTDNLEYNLPVFIITKEDAVTEETSDANETTEKATEIPTESTDETKEQPQEEITESTSCSDTGKICNETEKCDGEIVPSLEGSCCLGNCLPQTSSNPKPFIGVLIIIAVFGVLGYLYWKAKKKQKPKKTEQILKEKSKKFADRMKNISKEVTGNLKKD